MTEVYGMYTNVDRIKQLLGFQESLQRKQTHYEQLFQNILEGIQSTRDIGYIETQKIFTDGRVAYIADFYLPKYKLVFEIDGKQHQQQIEYDNKRTSFLNSYFKLNVVRFTNQEVTDNTIIDKVRKNLKVRTVPATMLQGLTKKQIKAERLRALQDTNWVEECTRRMHNNTEVSNNLTSPSMTSNKLQIR